MAAMSVGIRANNCHRSVLTVAISVLAAGFVFAGPDLTIDKVDSKQVNLDKEGPTVEIVSARESRGLITLEGPSGMFINPTSATLPQGTFILNYCVFVPTLPEGLSLVGHGILLSYGVTDWLEVGFIGDLLDLSTPDGAENTYVIGGAETRDWGCWGCAGEWGGRSRVAPPYPFW